jgi:hypothetical protein
MNNAPEVFGTYKQAERRQRLVLDSAEVRSLEDVLEHLNELFRRVILGIDLPNSTGRARLDSETLLPLVDEQPFHKRGEEPARP